MGLYSLTLVALTVATGCTQCRAAGIHPAVGDSRPAIITTGQAWDPDIATHGTGHHKQVPIAA
jgi:hypothetical protein